MTDMTAAVILTLKDKLTSAMKKVVGQMRQTKTAINDLNRAGASGGGVARQFSQAQIKARALRMEMGRLKTSLGGLKKASAGLFKRGLAVGGGMWAARGLYYSYAASMVGAMLGPAKEMEMFRMQLEQLEGSSAKGKQAMAWISDFAKRTPLEIGQVIDAYAQMKNMGLDPTNGSLQAVVDTMAMSGKGFENLDSIILGMGQAWTKQKLQGDDARQLLEAGVPVWDLLAKKMGKSAKEVMKLSEKGKLGRKEIQLLIDAMGERAAGASDRMSTSWTGIMSNLSDAWYQFRAAIADSGPFAELKVNLQGILTTINQMQADGRLQKLAADIGGNLKEAIQNAAWALRGMWSAGLVAAGVIDRIAQAVGGYENLGYFAAGLLMVGKALAVVQAAGSVAVSLGKIASLSGIGVSAGLLATAGGIAAIAGSLYLLQQNRGGIMDWMEQFRVATDDFRARKPLVVDESKVPFGMAPFQKMDLIVNEYVSHFYTQIDAAFQTFTASVRARAMGMGVAIKDGIVSGLGSLFDVGAQFLGSLWEGMKAKFGEMLAWASSAGAQIKGALSIGGPVSTRNYSGSQMGPAPAAPTASTGGGGGWGADGARALGGSVYRGKSYLVGERGPEIVTPQRYGHVTPLSKGGGRNVTVHMGGITINGNADQAVLSKLAQMLTEKLRAGLHDGAYA